MYELIDENTINYIYNSDLYTDHSIGEIDTGVEVEFYEDNLYMIHLVPCLNLNHLLEIKIYKKDKPIYDICRLNFYKNEYIKSNTTNTFTLSFDEQNMINHIIETTDKERPIYWINFEISNSLYKGNEIYFDKYTSIKESDFIHYKLYVMRRRVMEKEYLCPYCRKLVSYTIKIKPRSFVTGGKVIFYDREYAICNECNEEIDIPRLLDRNNAIMDEAIKNSK